LVEARGDVANEKVEVAGWEGRRANEDEEERVPV
jgi:hypothetical protein